MLTKKFNASIVFADNDKSGVLIEYPVSPVQSSGLQILRYDEVLKANKVVLRNCQFLVSPKDNPKYMEGANGKHIVSREEDLYSVTAFPYGRGMKSGTGFSVIAPLPKGLVMRGERTVTGSTVYYFEGLNLALFDQAPVLN